MIETTSGPPVAADSWVVIAYARRDAADPERFGPFDQWGDADQVARALHAERCYREVTVRTASHDAKKRSAGK